MNKNELLKELNGFPKEFQPTNEKQDFVLQNILSFYDNQDKQKHKRIFYKKWSTSLVSVAAVLLAGFLLLPSILNQQQENNHTSQSQMDQQDSTLKKESTPNEEFHPNELANMKRLTISDHTGVRIKEISNSEDLALFSEKFKNASLFAKVDEERGNSLSNNKYLLTIDTENNFIELEVWPNEKEGNVYENQTRNWWTVEGLDDLMKNLVPNKLLSYDQVVQIAKTLYPDVNWEENELSFIFVDKGSLQTTEDQVWKANGVTASGERLTIYIDRVTGDILKEENPESTDAGINAVKSFFHLVGAGNYEAAWDLIHSKSKKPTPTTQETLMKQSFDDFFKEHQPQLKAIQDSQWNLFWKSPDCQCRIENTVRIKALLDNGQQIDIHAAKDKDNQWKLFWSSQGKLN